MKQLIILTMVVLMGGSPALAGSWDGIFGSYGGCGYGWGGSILGEVTQWQLANRQLDLEERKVDIAENQLGKMNQRNEKRSCDGASGTIYGVAIREQSREIQHLRLENKQLLAENAELKNQITEMRKEIAEMKQAFEKLVKKQK